MRIARLCLRQFLAYQSSYRCHCGERRMENTVAAMPGGHHQATIQGLLDPAQLGQVVDTARAEAGDALVEFVVSDAGEENLRVLQ